MNRQTKGEKARTRQTQQIENDDVVIHFDF